jgi:type 1 glutamine amidotransferase
VEGPYRLKETLYRSRPLASTCQALVMGKSLGTKMPDEPVAWTNTYQTGRVFYTSMGARTTFQEPWFRRMVVNAVYWCLGKDAPGAKAQEPPVKAAEK